MEKKELKDSIKYFSNRAFKTKKRKILCFILRNHSYYRYSLYKNYCKSYYYKNKNKLFYLIAMYKYSKYSTRINVQIKCQKFMSMFYFEHYNIVINQHSIIGSGIRCIGNNCIGGNDRGATILGNNV